MLSNKQRHKLSNMLKAASGLNKSAQFARLGDVMKGIGLLTGSGGGQYSIADVLPYTISKKLFPITTRVKLPDTVLSNAAQQFGGTLGKNLAEALTGGIGSTFAGIGGALSGSPDSIINQLMKEDSIIGGADKKLLLSAYETLRSVAPTLSKDKNAVKSFLREVAMSGTGPDYSTIKQLADAERSITGGSGRR